MKIILETKGSCILCRKLEKGDIKLEITNAEPKVLQWSIYVFAL